MTCWDAEEPLERGDRRHGDQYAASVTAAA